MSKRRERETPEYAAMVRRVIRAHGRRVGDADPEDLGDLLGLREVVEEAIAEAVAGQRSAGASWARRPARPRLLDLFCGAGGSGVGYHRAGFDVTGVDHEAQADYPHQFVEGDAIDYLTEHGHEYAVIHASPPCQASCALTKGTNRGRQYLNLIPKTRAALARLNRPTIIENVQGSDIRRDLTLCGEMFGLGVIRHRYFELGNFAATNPKHRKHRGRVAGYRHGEWSTGPYFAVYGNGGGKGTVTQWQAAMGIDWTADRKAIAEAIPPAYTEFIGHQLRAHLMADGRPS